MNEDEDDGEERVYERLWLNKGVHLSPGVPPRPLCHPGCLRPTAMQKTDNEERRKTQLNVWLLPLVCSPAYYLEHLECKLKHLLSGCLSVAA